MKLLITTFCFGMPLLLWTMQEEQIVSEPVNVPAPLSRMQKTKKCLFNCCMPKIVKIACAYCCCGTSCTQSIQSFGEYKIVQAVIPWMENPYCLATTLTVGACVSCGYGLYTTESCCFKPKNINPRHQEQTMEYETEK